ncbi:MAG: MBL fold metallo-hydrolase [Alphaproteobacteria bacterium]|nr:MBL fold metallo-hydrolase [Alphaproteobacteria bacterium]
MGSLRVLDVASCYRLSAWAGSAGSRHRRLRRRNTHCWHGTAGSRASITFFRHASFLIESPAGPRILADYSETIRAPVRPETVTMNNAHPAHASDTVEAEVR